MDIRLIGIVSFLFITSIGYSKRSGFQSYGLSENKLTRTVGVVVEMCCKDNTPSSQKRDVDLVKILVMLEDQKSMQVYDSNAMKNIVYSCPNDLECKVVSTLQTPSDASTLHARSYCAAKGILEEIKEEFKKAKQDKAPFVPLIVEGKPEISVAGKKFVVLNSCNTNIAEMNNQEKGKKQWKSVDHQQFAEAIDQR